jgi:cytoskeletal protein RodZ
MPKKCTMAHVSRPIQIALVAVVLLGGVWLFALRGHSSSSSESSSPPPSSPSSPAKNAATPSPVYHGSAPGVEGLTKAVAKAHGAVATSQQNAHQLEQDSSKASDESAPTATTPAHAPAVAKAAAPAKATATVKAPAAGKPVAGTPARQQAVEAKLAQGNVVLVLFWSPKGTDDVAVAHAVTSAVHGHVFAFRALATEVASFGTVTRGIQVYGTPTLLVVGKSHQAKVLTGLTDVFSIEQAISEARSS